MLKVIDATNVYYALSVKVVFTAVTVLGITECTTILNGKCS